MVANVSVVSVVLVECSCCGLPTGEVEIDPQSGECAACVFVGWVASMEATAEWDDVGEREVA